MKIIFLHSFLFIYIIHLHGFIFLNKILKINQKYNFYEISIIGLVITIFFAQFLYFFVPLNDNLLILNIILLLIYSIFFYKELFVSFKINLTILSILLIILIFNIYGSNFSDDINHYHYSYIANADTVNFIWGSSFLHPLYGTNPSWLVGHSYLNFDQYRLQDIHVLNGIIFFLVLGCFISELYSNNKKEIYYPILFSITLFLLLKYTRLKEFGIDRPSTLLFCFLIFYYLKFFLKPQKKDIQQNFIIIFLLSFSIFSIKIIYLPIILFSFFILFKKKSLIKIKLNYLIILFPIIIFIMKNLLGSGCLIFPVINPCVEYFPWSNQVGAKELSTSAEIFNKSWHSYSGTLNKENYIKNFNWFNSWFMRSRIEILELLLTIFLIIFITIFTFNLKFTKKNYSISKFFKNFRFILVSITIFSLLIYLIKNPVIRMNHHIVISLMVLVILSFLRIKNNEYKKRCITGLLFIGLIFNLTKNYQRISKNDFINNPYSMISEKIIKQEKKNIDSFVYYVGWYGKAPISNSVLKNKRFKKFFVFKIIY